MDYLENREWEEVPMWKALKLWANNRCMIKCVEGNTGNIRHYYGGQSNLSEIRHSQVINGKWFVEKH